MFKTDYLISLCVMGPVCICDELKPTFDVFERMFFSKNLVGSDITGTEFSLSKLIINSHAGII